MTKLADLRVAHRLQKPLEVVRSRPASVDDLVEVLAHPEVQEALGAKVRTIQDQPCANCGCNERHTLKCCSTPDHGREYLVVPLSRLEDG